MVWGEFGCTLGRINRYYVVPANMKIIYKPKKIASVELSHEVCKIVEVFKEAVRKYNEFELSVDM